MPIPDELMETLIRYGGTVTTAQANEAGVSNERLRLLAASGELSRAAHGVYILPEEFEDKMFIMQLRRSKIIYSHDTALYLHDLSDRDPLSYTVTVPRGYNTAKLRGEGFKVFTVKSELHQLGATNMKTMFGHTVVAYGMERTICDCLRSRSQMDIAILTDAMKRYARRKDKDLNVLMSMAQVFSVDKLLRNYMEVLL